MTEATRSCIECGVSWKGRDSSRCKPCKLARVARKSRRSDGTVTPADQLLGRCRRLGISYIADHLSLSREAVRSMATGETTVSKKRLREMLAAIDQMSERAEMPPVSVDDHVRGLGAEAWKVAM